MISINAVQALTLLVVGARCCIAALVDSHKPITAYVTVDPRVRYQEVDGFGVSEAFQRAEDVLGKGGLSESSTQKVLDLLFSVDKGAGFAILRNGIGSSNSSASNFMNSIEPFSPGSPSSKPNYVWDQYDSGQFPLAKQAYQRDLKLLYANAWSAPGYMKTNKDENNGGYLCGVYGTSCSEGSWMQAYANYLVEYLRIHRQSGVDVTNVGFLNEPQLAPTYAGMLSDGAQAAEFIRVLARTIKASGLAVHINCCDGIGWAQQQAMMAGLAEGPDPAEQYLDVVTGHGYESAPNFTLTTSKKTWLTEWADLSGQYTPTTFYSAANGPGEGMTWARNIQVAFLQANVSAFLYWIGAEAANSNSALITLSGDEIIPSKRFWAFAQFSKFARPGARRIAASSSDPLLTASGFINTDGRIVTQLINNSTSASSISFRVTGGRAQQRTMTPHLTNNEHNLTAMEAVSVGSDGSFRLSVPARSMMSVVAEE